jgi:hypothetical protein
VELSADTYDLLEQALWHAPIPFSLTPLGSAVAALMREEEIERNGG